MTALFLLSVLVSAAVFYYVFMRLDPSHHADKWAKMRDEWRAYADMATFHGLSEKHARANERAAYCDQHITFWTQPLWKRILWLNYPKK